MLTLLGGRCGRRCPQRPLQGAPLNGHQRYVRASVDPKTTRVIYDKSLKGFADWLWSQSLEYEEIINGPSEVCDTTVVEYLQLCCDCGMPKATSGSLISAIQDKRPALRLHLPAAWRA
eukprot:11312285-Heterocapsa_arctica.AAC.1